MTALTKADLFWRAMARYPDRTALRLVASQRVLRALFEVSARLGSALPRGASLTRDRDGGLTVRPRGVARDAPAIFYIHGGGFTIGSPRTHAALAGHLAANMGLRAYLPRYRLAPEHRFPAPQEDVVAAYTAFVAAQGPPVALCGDSAGGCLALHLAQVIRDRGLPAPAALGLIAPIADLSGDPAHRFASAPGEILIPPEWPRRILAAHIDDADRVAPTASPLLGDLSGLPPTLIQFGTGEVLAQDAHRLARAMDDCTLAPWDGLPHVWHVHAGRAPAADRAIAEMAAFLSARAP